MVKKAETKREWRLRSLSATTLLVCWKPSAMPVNRPRPAAACKRLPLSVTLSLGILAISGSLGAPLLIVFAIGAFAKLVNVAFGFSPSQSANAIVYQSLPDTIRGRVQATAEGTVQPIAIGLAGLSLLALTAGLKFSYIGLAYVLVGLGIAWLIVIFLLSGNYVQALTRVITKRRLGDNANMLADPASLALLRNRLQDAHPGVVIYALNKLEALDGQAVIHELPNLIKHPAPEVRREAFVRVEKLKLHSALKDMQNQLAIETIPSVKESAAQLKLDSLLASPSIHDRNLAVEWFSGQLKFIESHIYFTASARALRNAGQEKNIAFLKKKLEEVGGNKKI